MRLRRLRLSQTPYKQSAIRQRLMSSSTPQPPDDKKRRAMINGSGIAGVCDCEICSPSPHDTKNIPTNPLTILMCTCRGIRLRLSSLRLEIPVVEAGRAKQQRGHGSMKGTSSSLR